MLPHLVLQNEISERREKASAQCPTIRCTTRTAANDLPVSPELCQQTQQSIFTPITRSQCDLICCITPYTQLLQKMCNRVQERKPYLKLPISRLK